MYALKNKVQLIGNLGSNPEIKTLDGGKKMAKFNIATNESYRNSNGEKVTETQWHNLVDHFHTSAGCGRTWPPRRLRWRSRRLMLFSPRRYRS